MADPWFKFFPTDWRNDPALKMCSMAARGLWIELICLMHQATPYGHLLVNGQAPTDAQIAVLVGAPPDQIAALLGELESAGIFSRTRNGVIYSRKLTRMSKKAATARNNGRKGGNPSLSKEREKSPSDNPTVKGGDKPQKPEARSQRLEEKEDTNVSSQKRAKRATTPEGFDDFWSAYPHRNGVKRGRQKAEQKFRTAVKSGMTPDALTEAANRYRQDRQVIDGYAKDPATWLNGKCWEDEIEHPENVHAMRRKPEPGDRRTHPVTGQAQYYVNHAEGWMNEVC